MMWWLLSLPVIVLGSDATVVEIWHPAVQSRPEPRLVHGFLDAHWEYPNFLPDDVPNETALPFNFVEKKWDEFYFKPVLEGMRYRPNETVCFRVVGKGYVAPRAPTYMWPADREFIFTRIIKMTQMRSGAECAKRMRRKVS